MKSNLGYDSRSAVDRLLHRREELVDGDAALLGRVALAQRDGAVALDRVEVDRDAERSPDFVHPAVAAADRAGGVVGDVVPPLQLLVDFLGALDEERLVLDQGEDGALDRREARVELEERARLAADLQRKEERGGEEEA